MVCFVGFVTLITPWKGEDAVVQAKLSGIQVEISSGHFKGASLVRLISFSPPLVRMSDQFGAGDTLIR